MNDKDITLKTFLDTIFVDLPEDQRICLTRPEVAADGKTYWMNRAATARFIQQIKPESWYFGVSSVAPAVDGKLSRARENLREAYCIVLDDVGTKAEEPTVVPSWKLESSAGNYQWGYLIDPLDMTDPADLAFYEGCVSALGEAGYSDKGAGGSYRVMRVPGSIHLTKDFTSNITEWNPKLSWDLGDLMAELGVDPDDQPVRILGALKDRVVNDATLTWLEANGMTTGKKDARFVEILCPWRHEHESGGDTAGYTPIGYEREQFDGAFNCHHEHCRGRGKAEFKEWMHKQAVAIEVSTDIKDILIQGKTEDAVAIYAALALKGKYLFATGGSWMKWVGTHWQPDSAGSVQYEIRQFARWHNTDDGKTLAKASFVSGVMRFMQHDPVFVRSLSDFDNDEFLLATPAGTVDLRTGELRKAKPEDLISKITRARPALFWDLADRFKSFLLEIMDGDAESVDFLQRAMGAMLSGAINEHWIMFWIGQGRNGKNTLGDLVQWLMGDYATVMLSDSLMAKKNEAHPTEIMTLRGRRMVTSSEISEGAYWNESRLNQVTGDAVLTGRYMRGDFIEFRRTHKHLVYGNHRPQLRNVSPALRARVKVMPFNVSFVGREDATLGDTLRDEAGGVLSWLIEGHLMWMKQGQKIGSCPAVDEATREYFESQNTIQAFVDERCIVRPGAFTPTSSLYEDYRIWKVENGEHPVAKTRFSEQLTTIVRKKNTAAARGFEGVILGTSTHSESVAKLIK